MKMLEIVFLATLIATAYCDGCNSRTFSKGAVCVCDSTSCDTVPELAVPSGGYQIYSTSKSSPGFNTKTASFGGSVEDDSIAITVNRTITHQNIIGFGGAFTDSAGINIKSLPEEAQEKLLASYFANSGIEYTLCRVPVGGTDFSTRGYSYDDSDGDETLEHFSLAQDDFDYKIPYILKAKELTNNQIKLFSSVWTAPKWMKTNNGWAGIGTLKKEYYQVWADYLLRFYEEYEKQNITFWGMTPQNEPIDGFIPEFLSKINAMGWVPSDMNKFIANNLGPSLRNSSYKDIKILLHDDNRALLPALKLLLANPVTLSYADGVAFHYYTNSFVSPSVINTVRAYKEDLIILQTEACNGFQHIFGLEEAVEKGSWERGAKYANDIFGNLQYGANGWVDWNMVLDETGGPTYIDNYVDSPILVNATLQEFYKQPMFYVLGHFSKFIRPGSVRLETTVSGSSDLQALAFLRPDNLTALVIFNSGSSDATVQIGDTADRTAQIEIESNSINTVIYE